MSKLQRLIDDACIELKDWMEDNPGVKEPHDAIFEIADSNTPIYNSDIMEIAAEDYEIMSSEPEIGPAFDGKPTPLNIAAANIFEAIEQGLWEYWNEHKDDFDDNLTWLWEEIEALIEDAPQELKDRWNLITDIETNNIRPECKDDAESLLDELETWDFQRGENKDG